MGHGEGAYNLPVLKSIDFAFQEGANPLPAPVPVDKTYLRQLVEFAEGAMGAKLVTLISDEGAKIYYTTDETQPNEQSALYTWPLVIRKTTTVKAVAYLGGASSNVAAQTITVDLGENAYASFTRFTLDGITWRQLHLGRRGGR